MAFQRGNTMKVTYTFRDKGKKPSYASYYIGELAGQLPNPNEAEFTAFVQEFGNSLIAVSDCYIENVTVSFDYYNDAAKTFGAAADVERKAVFSMKTEDQFTTIFTIPGAKYEIFGPDGESIIRDTSNSTNFTGNPRAVDLNSIRDKLVNGPTINLATYPVTDRREKDIISLDDAYKQHRSNPRG